MNSLMVQVHLPSYMMKRFYKRYEFWGWFILAFGVLFILFFSISPAFGAVLIDNLDDSGYTADNNGVGRCGTNEGSQGNDFMLDGNYSVSDIRVKMRRQASPTDSVGVRLRNGTSSLVNDTLATSSIVDYTNIVAGSYPASSTITFSFDPVVALEADTQYWFEVFRNGTGNDTNYYVTYDSFNDSSYASGTRVIWTHSEGGMGCDQSTFDVANTDPDGDLFFQVLGVATGISGDIDFIQPTNSSTTNNLFGALGVGTWGIDIDLDNPTATTTNYYIIQVIYNATGSSVYFEDSLVFPVLTSSYPISGGYWIEKTANLSNGEWLATAKLWNIDDPEEYFSWRPPLVAPSLSLIADDSISFTIIDSDVEFGLGTSTIIFALIDCPDSDKFFSSTTLSGWVCGIENAFKNSVNSGANAVIGTFNVLGNLLLKIFPLSIYKHLNMDFNSVVATSAPAIVLSGDDIFGGRSFTILDEDIVNDAIGNVGFDYKSFLDKFFYAMTGLIIIYQSAKIVGQLRQENNNNYNNNA